MVPQEQRLWSDVCLRGYPLHGPDREPFDAYEEAAKPVPDAIRCRRVSHHRGRHLGVGVRSGNRREGRFLWWGRWWQTIFDAEFCAARAGDEWCWLPAGHPSVLHTFDYHPDLAGPLPVEFLLTEEDWHEEDWHEVDPREDWRAD